MICPKCEGEFREGYTRCNRCDVDLIPELATKYTNYNKKDPENLGIMKFLDLKIEKLLKIGGIVYVVINGLHEIAQLISESLKFSYDGGPFFLLFGFFLAIFNNIMPGLYYFALGHIIEIMKRAFINE